MLTSKRTRTLSDEGLSLFNLAHVQRNKLSVMMHDLFWSDYDQRLEDVLQRCHDSAVALVKHWNMEVNRDEQPVGSTTQKINNGLRNAVRLILSPNKTEHLGTKKHRKQVQQNFRFYCDVMKRAFENGDHQSSMLYHLALTHACVKRLNLKHPKRMKDVWKKIDSAYGTMRTGFAEHVRAFLYNGFSNDFIPSVIAMSIYCKRNKTYDTNQETAKKDLLEIIEIYGYIHYFINYNEIPLYEDNQVVERDLFDLSHHVQRPKAKKEAKSSSRWFSLRKRVMQKHKKRPQKCCTTPTEDTFEVINPLWVHGIVN
jgi:hypothetical protein